MKEAVLLLGNELKSDDSVGKYITDRLRKKNTKKLLVYGGIAPENSFHKLRGVSALYIVDSGEFGGRPGEIRIFKGFPENLAISTHTTNMAKIVRYLKMSLGIKKIRIILIQPKTLSFGSSLSPEVSEAADRVVDLLSEREFSLWPVFRKK